ncbi:flagella protein [Methanosalsum zhilinae DSM 4017]|uniref:Flagella protein n=2 Tax=Methanosalsum zhilinae TaxID=39669 RepID=F7XM56_METZD|nr:flagella protein [Methanosalsum zhilinae DSM 4017]
MVNLKKKLKRLKIRFAGKEGSSGSSNSPFGPDDSLSGPPGFDTAPDISGGSGFPGPDSLPDLDQMSLNGPSGDSQTTPAASGGKTAEENRERINSLEKKLSKFEMSFNMMERENKDIKDTVQKIDQSVIELLSLYEIVSNQVNPFVGESGSGRDTIERFDRAEKRINEIGDAAVMLRNDVNSLRNGLENMGMAQETEERIGEIESKFDAFSDAMSMIHESLEQLSESTKVFNRRCQEIEDNILDLAESTSSIMERIDRLESTAPDPGDIPEPVSSAPLCQEEPAAFRTEAISVINPAVRLESVGPDTASVVILLNWIEFLMERVGRNNLMDALDYYVDIGWISEEVRSEIMTYARGIDYYVEKSTWRLLPEDHTKSLLFIERLCGRKIDKNMLGTLDREMARVKHGLEELYGI